jgi:hypothetical protein
MARKFIAALAVVSAFGLALPGPAKADTILGADGHLPPGCSRGQYAAAHYRFPLVWRVYARLCIPPVPETYASDRYSNIPPSYYVHPACCPYLSPSTLYDYPTLSNQTTTGAAASSAKP